MRAHTVPKESILLGAGTLGFRSPELAAVGLEEIETTSWSAVDERSDIFSLGCLLGYSLTGQNFTDPDAFIKAVRSKRGVPKRLRQCILKAVESDPRDRYSSAEKFAEALEFQTSSSRKPLLAIGTLLILAWICFGLFRFASSPASTQVRLSVTDLDSIKEAITNATTNTKPSWIEELAKSKRLPVDAIRKDHFNIQSRVVPVIDRSAHAGCIWIALDETISDFQSGLEFRIVGKPWERAGSRSDKGQTFAVTWDDVRRCKQVEVRLNSNDTGQDGFIVGPFQFDLDLSEQVAHVESERLVEAKDAIARTKWLLLDPEESSMRWMLDRNLPYSVSASVRTIKFGLMKDKLEFVLPVLEIVSASNEAVPRFSVFSETSSVVAGSELIDSLNYALNKLLPPHYLQKDSIYATINYIDGTSTEIIEFFKPVYFQAKHLSSEVRKDASLHALQSQEVRTQASKRDEWRFGSNFARQYWHVVSALHLGKSSNDLSTKVSLELTATRLNKWGEHFQIGSPPSFILDHCLEECPDSLLTADPIYWQIEFLDGTRSNIIQAFHDDLDAKVLEFK